MCLASVFSSTWPNVFQQECESLFLERKAQGITLAAAKYSSEDAAILVEYIISLVEYTRLYKPYKKALEYLEELIREKEEDEKRSEMEQLKHNAPSKDVRTCTVGVCHCHDYKPQDYNVGNDVVVVVLV